MNVKKEIGDVLTKIKKQHNKQCLVCGNNDSFNVCIECDAIVTARKAYKRFYKNSVRSDESNTISNFKREKEIKYYKEEAQKYLTSVGLEGLDQKEKQSFWNTFYNETKKLENYFRYMQAVLHFNDETKTFYDNSSKWFDELKKSYMLRPKIIEDDLDVPF